MWKRLIPRRRNQSPVTESASKLDVTSQSEKRVDHRATDQTQTAQQNGTAIQAGRDVVVYGGMTYSDVKDAALGVFEANFYRLSSLARQTAEQRAEEVTEKLLERLLREHPEGFAQANDPGFQHALYTVQREHARTGDVNLGGLLVDLLVDRTRHPQRDIMQIVLDESLNTAPKLTEGQLAVLSVVFLFKYTQNQGIGNHQMLGSHMDRVLQPFAAKVQKNNAWYQHLEFTGCGTIGLGEIGLESILGTTYQGLFLKGFDPSEISARGITAGSEPRLFMSCLNDPSKIQVRTNSHETLESLFDQAAILTEDRQKIKGLFDETKMSESEIQAKCIELCPYMAHLFDVWSDSPMKNFTLTSVGIAIGHANIRKIAGEFANLAIWIN